MSFLKHCCDRYCIILHKGDNQHILGILVWNWVLHLKLKLYKWLHGIHHPIVHYYAVCWNEEAMLPFMFDYYEQFVDRFTIYDNYSDDNSKNIIRSHPNTEIIPFRTDGFNDNVHNDIKNYCWKKSRGKADYVIVCDIDEFLYIEDPTKTLDTLLKAKISLPLTEGYNMYSTEYPLKGTSILKQVTKGIQDNAYNKSLIFDPHRIVEINYMPGAHIAKPTGIVKKSSERLKVLHFKNLGLDYLLQRYHILADRLSEENKKQNLGIHYLYSDEKIIADFNDAYSRCQTII